MIARHFWAKADGNMPPPISTLAPANVLTWKAFWENETSPQKSIGDPYFLWLDMHRSAARIIICKLIDPNVMQTILEWEAESLNGLCIFCWLHSQMWQWPWWPTSNQAGQGRGAAIIWKKARLQKFFNFTFCPTLWQLIWQGYWMRSQETCMWSQLVIRAKVEWLTIWQVFHCGSHTLYLSFLVASLQGGHWYYHFHFPIKKIKLYRSQVSYLGLHN